MDMKLEPVAIPVTDVDRAKAFYVDQAARAERAGRGVPIYEVQDMDWGSRHAYFQDPDGNAWQLQQPAAVKAP